jgi:hypothetical protein
LPRDQPDQPDQAGDPGWPWMMLEGDRAQKQTHTSLDGSLRWKVLLLTAFYSCNTAAPMAGPQ